jgi:hypothetical protein
VHPTWFTSDTIIRQKHDSWLHLSIPWITMASTDTFRLGLCSHQS